MSEGGGLLPIPSLPALGGLFDVFGWQDKPSRGEYPQKELLNLESAQRYLQQAQRGTGVYEGQPPELLAQRVAEWQQILRNAQESFDRATSNDPRNRVVGSPEFYQPYYGDVATTPVEEAEPVWLRPSFGLGSLARLPAWTADPANPTAGPGGTGYPQQAQPRDPTWSDYAAAVVQILRWLAEWRQRVAYEKALADYLRALRRALAQRLLSGGTTNMGGSLPFNNLVGSSGFGVDFGADILGAIGAAGQGVASVINAIRGTTLPGGALALGNYELGSGNQILLGNTGTTLPATTAAGGCPTSSPWGIGGTNVRAQAFVVANPVSGKPTWFRPAGRPLLWSADLSACRRVRKIAGKARRRVGGR